MALDIPAQFNVASWFLDRPARSHPDRIAILGEPSAVSYGELAGLANCAGNALRAMGCAVGDRVLMVLPDSKEFIAAFFGTAKIGAVAVPVNSMARSADYSHYISDSGARFAIVHSLVLPEFLPALEDKKIDLIVVGRESSSGRGQKWDRWIASASEVLDAHLTAARDTAFFLYTSGSSGRPKAAVHQHKDMLVTTRSFADGVLGIRPDDRTFSISKLFFAYGLGNGMYFPLSAGASTILNPERTKIERVAELLVRHRPTLFFAVPTFYAALLQEASRGLRLDFSSVRLVASAGEPLPSEMFSQFKDRFGLEILDGIGSTEMLHDFISNRPGYARPGTCGVPVPNFEARIVTEEGYPVAGGEIGNLWAKGESGFAAYWNKPEQTMLTKVGEWIVTGDKFFQDQDGYFHYCGRSDDMMKVSGMWVSPSEVENALLADSRVAEVAVVGSPDGSGLIKPVAFVVLRPGHAADADLAKAIQESARTRLVSYKCPREVRFVEEIPKTATGKLQRFRLREQPKPGHSGG